MRVVAARGGRRRRGLGGRRPRCRSPGAARARAVARARRERGPAAGQLGQAGQRLADRAALARADRLVVAVRPPRVGRAAPTTAAVAGDRDGAGARRCPRDHAISPRPAIRPLRLRLTAIAPSGRTSAPIWNDAERRPPARRGGRRMRSSCRPSESYAVATMRGAASTRRDDHERERRDEHEQVGGDDDAHPRLERLDPRLGARPGTSERKIGLMRDRMSGTPVRSLRT